MNYLAAEELEGYGLEASTAASWVGAASSLIDAYCRRPTLGISQFTERLRLTRGRTCVQLSYLPLAASGSNASPLVSARARYARPRHGEDTTLWDMATEVSQVFALPGTWVDVDASLMDYFSETGEVSWPGNPLGLQFQEIEVTYTAGFAQIPEAAKFACAQIVRNAQATPALNVHSSTLSNMHLEYFADTLLDQTVKNMLAPYMAQRVG